MRREEDSAADPADEAARYMQATGLKDKKNMFWMGGMMECFSSVMSIFGRGELTSFNEKDIEVPYDALTELVYLRSGAQGVVYSGTLNGEIVAVKKVRHKEETNIRHLMKLNHDNIVRFYGVCVESPDYCVIMEYCQYGSLYEFLGKGNLLPKQLVKWAKDIAAGMQYLHSKRIIHRDLKSPNVLIADDLVVKVSDFGTSRTWDDVSTIMTFNGTVAWMAPEVIRQEPCSERIDVWSYGVVLWEMLTREAPYRNMEAPSIMWGVGTDTLSLPIPVTCPNGVQMMLCQCWNRIPKNRPAFKVILSHLDMATADISAMDSATFSAKQAIWGEEVRDGMEKIFERNEKKLSNMRQTTSLGRQEKIRSQNMYAQQMSQATELYMEVCAVRLQLEDRERIVDLRERQLKSCRCGLRKNFKFYRQTSSSSEGKQVFVRCERPSGFRPKKPETHLFVNYIDKKEGKGKIVTLALAEKKKSEKKSDKKTGKKSNKQVCKCKAINARNNNVEPKDTVVEENGNVAIKRKDSKLNDCLLPDVAQV